MISPWVVGQTSPVWTCTFKDSSGNVVNLTGGTVVLLLNSGSGEILGTGVVVLTNASSGEFTYAPAAADSATPGVYQVQFQVTYASGPVRYSIPQMWIVVSKV